MAGADVNATRSDVSGLIPFNKVHEMPASTCIYCLSQVVRELYVHCYFGAL